MRDRNDFMENLKTAQVHLMILKEDIRYPLADDRQKLLDYAYILIDNLFKLEMKDDLKGLMSFIAENPELQKQK